MSQNFSYFSVSQGCPQSDVVTTTEEEGCNTLHLSRVSNMSQILHLLSILPEDVINSVISDDDDPVLKTMIDEEFKHLEESQKEQEKWERQLMHDHAGEKAAILWKIRKEIEEQKIAKEKGKEQELKQQLKAKRKQHEEAE